MKGEFLKHLKLLVPKSGGGVPANILLEAEKTRAEFKILLHRLAMIGSQVTEPGGSS